MPSSLIAPGALPPGPGRMMPFGARLLLAAITASMAMPAGASSGGSAIPFEGALRRAVAIEGAADQRFDLAERMAHYRVPGVGIAVIENCHIVDARGFGLRAWGGEPVSAETIFQAGSISKSVTAIGALRLHDLAGSTGGDGTTLANGRRCLGHGTQILRDWGGQTHRVTVEAEGRYLYNGQTWSSLSAIARAITGARWSGPRFFGTRS